MVMDYAHCKEAEMLSVIDQSREIMLKRDKPIHLLSKADHCYATPVVVRHAERTVSEYKHKLSKQAIIGLNLPKRMIVKGFNFLLGTDIRPFETRDEAIEYLTGN